MPWDLNKNQPYGVFKKLLLPPQQLKEEALYLKSNLVLLYNDFKMSLKNDIQIAWEFFFLFYSNRNKNKLFNTKSIKINYKESLLDFLQNIRLYRIPDSIRLTFINWIKKQWNIKLLDYSPTAREMLEFQSKGIRIITIDWNCALEGRLVTGNRDAFEHFLHDLEHCYKFFNDEVQYKKQVQYFAFLKQFYPEIENLLINFPDFKEKWNYLISDMNTHEEHLKHYTRAIFYELLKNLNKSYIETPYFIKFLKLLKMIDFNIEKNVCKI
jgi:hypothetical protein